MEEEQRLLNKSTHPDLKRQLEECQSVHEERLSVARRRFEMTSETVQSEFNYFTQQEQQCVSVSVLLQVLIIIITCIID